MPLLQGRGLIRRYDGRTVVTVDDIAVDEGEVLAVLGPNGAGKSTLFRLLGLLEAPDTGRVLLNGKEVRPGNTTAIRRLGAVFQQPHLFRGKVRYNVGWGLARRGVAGPERTRRVMEALESLGLRGVADADVATLSGGERQRVALARALVTRPEVLLLDEPTANLDVTVRRRFREDLDRIVRGAAGAAILITHDPTDAFGLADRIAIMEAGSIVQQGRPADLILAPATPFAAAFTGAELLLDGTVLSVEAGLASVTVGPVTLVATTAPDTGPVEPGGRVHVAYRPEDVVLAPADGDGVTSAVNRFRLAVIALVPDGALVRTRLEGDLSIAALVTRRSAEALALQPGLRVVAQIKATALRAFPAPAHGRDNPTPRP